jgi:hypothetical protein
LFLLNTEYQNSEFIARPLLSPGIKKGPAGPFSRFLYLSHESRGFKKWELLKVLAVKPPVSGEKAVCPPEGMGPDEKISDNALPLATLRAVDTPPLAGEECAIAVWGFNSTLDLMQCGIQKGPVCKLGNEFGVYNGAHNEGSLIIRRLECTQGLLAPLRIRQKDIEQDVGINSSDHLPLISSI